MEELSFGEYIRQLRKQLKMSQRDVEREYGVSNAYLSQLEQGDKPPPRPDILKKLALAYRVTVREMMLRAGYFDEPEVTATEDERVEAAFQYVMSDPDYKFGNRIRSEGLSLEAKRGIILVYQTLTNKVLITPEL